MFSMVHHMTPMTLSPVPASSASTAMQASSVLTVSAPANLMTLYISLLHLGQGMSQASDWLVPGILNFKSFAIRLDLF